MRIKLQLCTHCKDRSHSDRMISENNKSSELSKSECLKSWSNDDNERIAVIA